MSGNWAHPKAADSLGTLKSCTGRDGPQALRTKAAVPTCASPVKAPVPPGALANDAKRQGGALQGEALQSLIYAVTKGYFIDKLLQRSKGQAKLDDAAKMSTGHLKDEGVSGALSDCVEPAESLH